MSLPLLLYRVVSDILFYDSINKSATGHTVKSKGPPVYRINKELELEIFPFVLRTIPENKFWPFSESGYCTFYIRNTFIRNLRQEFNSKF